MSVTDISKNVKVNELLTWSMTLPEPTFKPKQLTFTIPSDSMTIIQAQLQQQYNTLRSHKISIVESTD